MNGQVVFERASHYKSMVSVKVRPFQGMHPYFAMKHFIRADGRPVKLYMCMFCEDDYFVDGQLYWVENVYHYGGGEEIDDDDSYDQTIYPASLPRNYTCKN